MKKPLFITMMAFVCALPAFSIGWEQVLAEKAMQTVFYTSKGTMLAADYKFDGSGGIYRSINKGDSWEKTTAPDHGYMSFAEHGGMLFAAGYAGMTRSSDDGKTWDELTSYRTALADCIPGKDLSKTSTVYSIAFKGSRLYVAEFNGYVLYSDDMGDSWTVTDSNGFAVESQDFGSSQDLIYSLVVYKNRLLAGCLYHLYSYDEAADKWTAIDGVGNCLSVFAKVDGTLFAGHAIEDDYVYNPFLEYTIDCVEWTPIFHPAGFLSNYVNSMTGFGKILIVGTNSDGIYTTFDMGESWGTYNNGLYVKDAELDKPSYLSVKSMTYDDKYVYVALYDLPFAEHSGSGVYRLLKSELKPILSGLSDVDATRLVVMADGISAEGGLSMSVYDVGGTVVASGIDHVSFSGLIPGVYVYKVSFEDTEPVCGKVVVK